MRDEAGIGLAAIYIETDEGVSENYRVSYGTALWTHLLNNESLVLFPQTALMTLGWESI